MAIAHDLEALADQLAKLAPGFAARAAAAAAPKLRALAEAQWRAGEGADSDPWAPLKSSEGAPLAGIPSQITVAAQGKSIVFTAPDWIKYHQGGFRVHVSEEAALQVALAPKGKLKREAQKAAKESGTKVPARAPFPKSNRAMPIAWGRCFQGAIEEMLLDEEWGS